MRTLALTAVCAALFSVSTSGLAQSSAASDANTLSSDRADKAGTTVGDVLPLGELDADNDGYISKTEVKHDNEMLTRFARFDTDKDDRLSQEEYAAFISGGAAAPAATASRPR